MRTSRGFTVIELIIVMAIIAVLLTFTSVSLLRVQNQATVSSAMALLLTDIRQQQLKAMNGEVPVSAGTGTYGIHFNANTYTLFYGAAYSPSDKSNFTITLDPGIVFSDIALTNSDVIFSPVSGEFENYSESSSSFSLKNTQTSEIISLHFNRYGTVLTP